MQKLVDQLIHNMQDTIKNINFSNDEVYSNWLAQQYYIVRHSTPLLAISCGLSIENREYHLRCIEHLHEERGHDKMILSDLKKLGHNIASLREMNSTKPIYQSQYYWIEHVRPISFLGYILFLESLAVKYGNQVFQRTSQYAATFLAHHHDADVKHLESAYLVIQNLDEAERRDIQDNLVETSYLYSKMLEELMNRKTIQRAS